jgi:ABC-2 type transport system ATP-binding protein
LARLGDGEPHADAATKKVSIPFSDGPRRLPQLVRELDDASIELEDISVRKPTLDDVFLSLTGRTAQETAEPSEPRPEAEPERVS